MHIVKPSRRLLNDDGGQQAADRTSEPFMSFGIHCRILYFTIFAVSKLWLGSFLISTLSNEYQMEPEQETFDHI